MSIDEVTLEKKQILVKFYFTNHKLLPTGIILKPRREAGIEAKHWMEGKKLGMPQGGLGTERRDRVDTGKSQQFTNVGLSLLWKRLMAQYVPTDIHAFFQEQSNGMKKPVVVVTFSEAGEKDKRIMRLIEQIEANFINHGTWGTVHYWQNPPGKPNTLNCMHRQPRQQTQQQASQNSNQIPSLFLFFRNRYLRFFVFENRKFLLPKSLLLFRLSLF